MSEKGMCDIALYGLGVMGSSLAKNMIRHGYKVAAFSKSEAERKRFFAEEGCYEVYEDEKNLVGSLKHPRIIFLMITAGSAVDEVITELQPLLEEGDVVIDGGNSNYHDTSRRCIALEQKGIHYLGVGVSGGEKGALEGPSMMAGGSEEGWLAVKEILQSIAASYQGEPCCAYIGKEGAGHYVKMVHNGIEYAVLQLIAETYHAMRFGLCLPHEEITKIFRSYRHSPLDSYLIDISVKVLEKMDEDATPLVEKILDVAGQKGTGKWTVEDAVARGVYIPTIFEAVFARNVSANKKMRVTGKSRLRASTVKMAMENPAQTLQDALLLGMILSYAQGVSLIAQASEDQCWDIDLAKLISVWRDGCIIRSSLLTEVGSAVGEEKENLILSDTFAYVGDKEPALRETVTKLEAAAIFSPALNSALQYYDSFRMDRMPVNFVQALRDCFGAHTYQRIDREGTFHTEWESEKEEI